MSRHTLDAVGDAGALSWCGSGTLSFGGAACGTLTASGNTITLTGAQGDGVLSNGSFNALSGIYDITPNEVKPKKVENTKLASGAMTSQPGTPDYGEVKFVLAQDTANTSFLNLCIDNKQLVIFKTTVNDADTGSSATFLGWIAGFTPLSKELKKDETAKMEVTIQITGKVNYTAGA